jgi:hypothetical protein
MKSPRSPDKPGSAVTTDKDNKPDDKKPEEKKDSALDEKQRKQSIADLKLKQVREY